MASMVRSFPFAMRGTNEGSMISRSLIRQVVSSIAARVSRACSMSTLTAANVLIRPTMLVANQRIVRPDCRRKYRERAPGRPSETGTTRASAVRSSVRSPPPYRLRWNAARAWRRRSSSRQPSQLLHAGFLDLLAVGLPLLPQPAAKSLWLEAMLSGPCGKSFRATLRRHGLVAPASEGAVCART